MTVVYVIALRPLWDSKSATWDAAQLCVYIVNRFVSQIRMALDKRTLYVQWDCFPDRKRETAAALHTKYSTIYLLERTQLIWNFSMAKIRKGVGKYLASRVTPRLEFRHDSFSAAQSELESAFADLERKEDEEQIETALRTKPPHR